METVQPAHMWVSQVGVAWALDEAPCPHELLATLIAIARRTDANGKGSRQSVGTIAQKVGKSTRQVKRDIARLCELGLLLEGDQKLVEKIPAGQRPMVYDIPLGLRGDKPSRNARGGRGDVDVTGDTGVTSDVDDQLEVTSTSLEGCRPRPFTGDVDVTQIRSEKELEEEVEQSLSSAVDDSPSNREREEISSDEKPKTSAAHQELAKVGATDAEAEAIIAAYPGKGAGWWRKLGGNGHLANILADTRQIAAEAEKARQASVAAAKNHGRIAASLPERSGYIPPGTKPPKPRLRGCGACKWGYVQIGGESQPCPDCAPVHAAAA
jgi:hypothetical protein